MEARMVIAGTAYAGQRAVIVTKHGKERAIAPALWEGLGLFSEVLQFDTDEFGTFTGEIARTGDQLDALRAKIAAGAKTTPYDAVFVASEGAFFPHPEFPVATMNRELVGLFDRERNIEIVGCAVSTKTNVTSSAVSTKAELDETLRAIGFPQHAAVLRKGAYIKKGVTDAGLVWEFVRECWASRTLPSIESDLRAHCNPTRMSVIAAATKNLVERVRSSCPRCARPGYWTTQLVPGLPCIDCGAPSSRAKSFVWSCQGCDLTEERLSEGHAQPGECYQCNP